MVSTQYRRSTSLIERDHMSSRRPASAGHSKVRPSLACSQTSTITRKGPMYRTD